MAVHKAAVDERIAVGNILCAILVKMPGVSPLQRPLGHQPGARGMDDRGQFNVVQVIARAVIVITTIINVAAVVHSA